MTVKISKDAFPVSTDEAIKQAQNAKGYFVSLLPVELPENFDSELIEAVVGFINNRLDEEGNGNPPTTVDIFDLTLHRLYPHFVRQLIANGQDAVISRNDFSSVDGEEFVEYTLDLAFEDSISPPEGGGDDDEIPGLISPPSENIPPDTIPPNPFNNPFGAPVPPNPIGLPPTQQPSKDLLPGKIPIQGGSVGSGGQNGGEGVNLPATRPTRPPNDGTDDDDDEDAGTGGGGGGGGDGTDDDDDDESDESEGLLRQILNEIRKQNELNREQERRLFALETNAIDRLFAAVVELEDAFTFDVEDLVNAIDTSFGEDLIDGLLAIAESEKAIDNQLNAFESIILTPLEGIENILTTIAVGGFEIIKGAIEKFDQGLGQIEQSIESGFTTGNAGINNFANIMQDTIQSSSNDAQTYIDNAFKFDTPEIISSMCGLIEIWKQLMNDCPTAGGKDL